MAHPSKLQRIEMSGSLNIPRTNLRKSNCYFERQPTSIFFVSCRTIMIMTAIKWSHRDIILNRSNNSVFLLRKSIEIGKSLISFAPREFEWDASSPGFFLKMVAQYFEVFIKV